jgi:hypothetical protein
VALGALDKVVHGPLICILRVESTSRIRAIYGRRAASEPKI